MSKAFYDDGLAPLEIKTLIGRDYFVKLVENGSDREILTAYIRGGEPFETLVPLGLFELRYASGQQWYGSLADFGGPSEGTVYSRCEKLFNFGVSGDRYNGYTVELIVQEGGNLETDPISPEDF